VIRAAVGRRHSLVVDVVHFGEETGSTARATITATRSTLSSDTPLDADHINYEVTLEDPKVSRGRGR
jgi:hypothetical protein